MRALPLIERGLLIVVVLLLMFLVLWHVRWRGIFAEAVAVPVACPGLVIRERVAVAADVERDWQAWCADAADSDPHHVAATAYVIVTSLSSADRGSGEAVAGGMWPGGDFNHGDGEVLRMLDPAMAERLQGLLARGLSLRVFPTIPRPGVVRPPEGFDRDGSVNLCTAAATRWYDQDARAMQAGGDPAAGLDALDVLDAAFEPGEIGQVRDAAYVDAQLWHALPAARLARWRAQDDPLAMLCAELESGRRRYFQEAADRFGAGPWHVPALSDNQNHAPGWHTWLRLHRDAMADWWNIPGACNNANADYQHDAAILCAADRNRSIDNIGDLGGYDVSRHRFALLSSAILEAWDQKRQTPTSDVPDLSVGPGRAGLTLTCVDGQDWIFRLSTTPGDPLGPVWNEFIDTEDGITRLPDWIPGPAFAWSGTKLLVRLPVATDGAAGPGPVTATGSAAAGQP